MRPDTALNLIGLATTAALTGLLTAVLYWFRHLYGGDRFRWWAWCWGAVTLYNLIGAAAFSLYPTVPVGHPIRLALSVASQVGGFLALVWLVAGTLYYTRRVGLSRKALRRALWVAGGVGLLCAMAYTRDPAAVWERFFFRVGIRSAVATIVFGWAGLQFWRVAPGASVVPRRLLAIAFLAFAASHLHYAGYGVARLAGIELSYRISYFAFLDVVLVAAIGIATVALALDDQRAEAAASGAAAREAEAALHRQDARFRRLIEGTSDIVTVLDQDGTITYESPSIARILGYDQNECLGHSAFEYLHPDDLPDTVGAFQRGVDSKRFSTHRFRFRHKDGSWVLLESLGQIAHDEAGKPIVILSSRDVTDRVRLERQLLEAQKMESVGRLAGGLAHDFNNILTIVKGNADLALGAIAEGRTVQDEVEEIREAADRASQLTRQLLLFARRQQVQATVIDVNELVTQVERMLRRLIGETVEFTVHPLLSEALVRVDPGQLEQVLLNLVVNARDAMPMGGQLTVTVSKYWVDHPLALGALEPGPYVTVAVRDTGVGISDQVKDRLFEPFFTTKAAGQGTGLGLATSYGIVRESGGLIDVQSVPGVGATFTIYLPEARGREQVTAPSAGPTNRMGRERLLVAEDDPAVRRVAVSALKELGYQVIEAGDGEEALAAASGQAPVELLVTDVVMPRLGGVDLVERLRVMQPDLPVVFTSGYTEELLDATALPHRATFLQKPYAPDDLADRIRGLLDSPAVHR